MIVQKMEFAQLLQDNAHVIKDIQGKIALLNLVIINALKMVYAIKWDIVFASHNLKAFIVKRKYV